MNIYNKLKTTLATLTVSCVPIEFGGSDTTYVIYTSYNEKGEAFANTYDEMAGGYYIQIDIWSNTLQVDLKEQIKTLLKQNGFFDITSRDLYDSQKRFDHTVIDCTYFDM